MKDVVKERETLECLVAEKIGVWKSCIGERIGPERRDSRQAEKRLRRGWSINGYTKPKGKERNKVRSSLVVF